MSKELIRLRDVCMAFDDELVLDHLNLYFNDKEFLTLLGPSGCGKTTTLRIIGGFATPTSGDVLFDGVRINDVPPYRRQINTVFQKYALFPHLNVYENIAFGLRMQRRPDPNDPTGKKKVKIPEEEIHQRVMEMLEVISLKGFEHRKPDALSGGQQQRVAIARALVNRPKVLLLDEPLGALDLKLRKDMQIELKRIQQQVGITFIYVTHDQEEALTLSDTIVVMNEGKIQQIGTPTDIYNEPQNSFVADFIGESNILNGKMICDRRVEFAGHVFDCVDEGFGEEAEVDVVIRPEDIYIMNKLEGAQFGAKVKSCTFKGVHYEMFVDTDTGYELMIQDYNAFEPGSEVGLIIRPNDIQVMRKERSFNSFEAEMVDETHVTFLGEEFECAAQPGIKSGDKVTAVVEFSKVELTDHQEDGKLAGEVHFLLYKGDHYHLTILTEDGDHIWVDTNDIWDKGDLVGINFAPKDIKLLRRNE